jgi:hypothetical protein
MKKCKGCKEPLPFNLRNGIRVYAQKYGYGLGCSCYTNWLISDEPEAKEKFDSFLIKNKKDYETKKKKEKSKAKEKLKTLSDWKSDLQKEINAIVRLIDNGWGCIATGSKKGKMNAGHYIGVGANETLRFHLENIWLQSEHSNMWKSGDTLRYQDGIVELYNKDYLERLNNLKSIPPIKLTVDEIKEKISIARSIIKWLKLQDRQFTWSERIELRIRFNKELGIYNN